MYCHILMVHSVHCRLDYCNTLLAGITDTGSGIKRLQSVQNTAARLVMEHDVGRTLLQSCAAQPPHWLPSDAAKDHLQDGGPRMDFKCIHGVACPKLHNCNNSTCRWRKFVQDVLDCSRHRLDVQTCQQCRRRWASAFPRVEQSVHQHCVTADCH